MSVTASSADGNFSIYVVLDADLAAAKSQLTNQKSPSTNLLDKKEKTKQATLDVSIPKGQAFTVLIANASGKKLAVSVKIANIL